MLGIGKGSRSRSPSLGATARTEGTLQPSESRFARPNHDLTLLAVACAAALTAVLALAPLAHASLQANTLVLRAQAPKVTLHTPLRAGSRYLALGDSVTFGYMEAGVTPPPDYHDASTFLGYPEHLGSALHLNVTNAACPGETSASLINASAPNLGCESAYRKAFPLHVAYKGSQLAFAVSFLRKHRDVKLVSLMIGANDLFLCQNTTKDGCASELNATLAQIGRNVRTILSAVRNRAHYAGQLAIVNYYSLNYSTDPADATLTAVDRLLNKTVDAAAKPFHAVDADGFGQFEAQSFRFGADPCSAGLLTLTQATPVRKCGIHPSYAGQSLLAAALASVIAL
jgi:lysophospholipase L1-like esterase